MNLSAALYWADREGNPPPSGAKFKLLPFFSKTPLLLNARLTSLPLLTSPTSAKILKKTFLPEKKEWIEKVEKALQSIREKKLQKIVLARTCILELDHAPDPWAITAALQQKAEGAFVFCLQTEKGAFLGATPERLLARQGREILTEAVAGTRPRGGTEEEDRYFAEELFSAEKDSSEHAPILTHLQNSLSPLCLGPLTFSPTKIHKTANVQHLYTSCQALLQETATDDLLAAQLHPTPALAGWPQKNALALIKKLEPFERGLYGGAIGWSTPERSEWIVAIRSCLLQGDRATLFSGAGIVEGSDPEKEWEELNQKVKLYDGILDH